MPLNLFYTMVQKSQKWPKTQIKGGPALRRVLFVLNAPLRRILFVLNSPSATLWKDFEFF